MVKGEIIYKSCFSNHYNDTVFNFFYNGKIIYSLYLYANTAHLFLVLFTKRLVATT